MSVGFPNLTTKLPPLRGLEVVASKGAVAISVPTKKE
jgi:hypothetical protein